MKLTFKHSGHLGDIVYSLLTVKNLDGGSYFIDLRAKRLSSKTARQMIDLLRITGYIDHADIYNNETIDYNLDRFRQNRPMKRHLIHSHWMSVGGSLDSIDPSQAWLSIPGKEVADIVICRCLRRNNPNYNKAYHNVLKNMQDRCVFLGFPNEYRTFKSSTGLYGIARHRTPNLVELAETISGAKVVLGNQSLGYALAEAMKIPRILELSPRHKNCMPTSDTGHTVLNHRNVKQYL